MQCECGSYSLYEKRRSTTSRKKLLCVFIGFVCIHFCLGIHICVGTQYILCYICQNYALGYCIPQGYYPCWGMSFSMNKYRGQQLLVYSLQGNRLCMNGLP